MKLKQCHKFYFDTGHTQIHLKMAKTINHKKATGHRKPAQTLQVKLGSLYLKHKKHLSVFTAK